MKDAVARVASHFRRRISAVCARNRGSIHACRRLQTHQEANGLRGCKAHLIVELDGQKNSVRSEIEDVGKNHPPQKPMFVERGLGDETMRSRLANPPRIFLFIARHRLDQTERRHRRPARQTGRFFQFAARLQKKHGLPIACFGHAGDGNIHVNVMVDCNKTAGAKRARSRAGRIVRGKSSRGAARSPANTASALPKNAGGRWPFQRKRANCTAS